MFNEIQEYSLLLQTYKLIGETDFSHIKPPKRFAEIRNLSREQLITLGFKAQPTSISHPTWWFTAALGSSWIAFYLYAEKPFT